MRQSTYNLGEVVHLLGTMIGDDLSEHIAPLIDRIRAGETLNAEDSGRLDGLMAARRFIFHHIVQILTDVTPG